MEIKIHPGQIRYSVNGNKVTAAVINCSFTLIDYLDDKKYPIDHTHCTDLILNKSYVGVAKCSAQDTFDLAKGKELARRRAICCYRNAVLRAFTKYRNHQQTIDSRVLSSLANDYDTVKRKYAECTDRM